MSCGSTIRNSPNNLEAASSSFWDHRWSWKIPLARLAGIVTAWERRWQRGQFIDELDDRLLADIGVSRTGAEEVRRSRLYLIAWRDSR
jgi:uncharacterized protein YjiS (DUF1127 family)